MIAGLKPYPEYKETGTALINFIPSGWEIKRLKSIADIRYGLSQPPRELSTGVPIIRATNIDHGRIVKKDLIRVDPNTIPTTRDAFLRQGDIIVVRSGAYTADSAIIPKEYEGAVAGYDMVIRVKKARPDFIAYALLSPYVEKNQLIIASLRAAQPHLNAEELGSAVIVLPPEAEQDVIIRFLDVVTNRLDRIICGKRKMIALLNEQKQRIINRAVTRGIDPTVSLKPSSIPGFDEIPQHWNEGPVKYWAHMNSRTLEDTTDPTFEFKYIDIGTVGLGRLTKDPITYRFANAPSRARRILVKGDTILSTVRTYLKAIWFVDLEYNNLIASTGFAVFSPHSEVEPEYLHYILQDNTFVNQVTANSTGIAYPAIAPSKLAKLKIALPPSREEQRQLLTFIKKQIRPLIKVINMLEKDIEILQEYQKCLISNLVTGKLDIRELVAYTPALNKITEGFVETVRGEGSPFEPESDERVGL